MGSWVPAAAKAAMLLMYSLQAAAITSTQHRAAEDGEASSHCMGWYVRTRKVLYALTSSNICGYTHYEECDVSVLGVRIARVDIR